MAREISRLQCGHFPTQTRVIEALSKLIKPPAEGNISLLDCCCGTGEAIVELKRLWNAPNVKTYGIEIDKGRAEQAEKNLDEVLWSGIEESYPSAGCSMMLANYPYDTVRGEGRLEQELYEATKAWPMKKKGLLVLIVPESILKHEYSDLAEALEREYEIISPFTYPEPERSEFGQCLLLCKRREKEIPCWRTPAWASMEWPTLPLDAPRPLWTLAPSANVSLRRQEVSDELILDTIERSPLKHSLLREALVTELPIPNPPLQLRAGHTALLLASGLCDSVIDDKEHGKFMVKGRLSVSNRKVKTEEKLDADGVKIADVDFFRTTYCLNVKALRENGSIEAFTSEPEPEELVNVDGEQEEV